MKDKRDGKSVKRLTWEVKVGDDKINLDRKVFRGGVKMKGKRRERVEEKAARRDPKVEWDKEKTRKRGQRTWKIRKTKTKRAY